MFSFYINSYAKKELSCTIKFLYQGTAWEHVPSDQTLASISCGADKQVWAIGRNGSAYWRFGIAPSNPIGKT